MSLFTDANISRVLCVEMEPYSFATAARETVYLASEWVLTSGSDTPAHTHYAGVVLDDVHFRREMFSGDQVGGRTIPDRGALSIINAKGATDAAGRYDDWLDPALYAWQAAPCRMYLYDKAQGFGSKTKIFDGVVDIPSYEESIIRFPLRNKLRLIDKLVQANKYDDTYGADIEGKPIPLAFGWMYNFKAVLQENRIYQIHDGAIESITAVRDKGSPLTFSSNVADRAALVAASPASGSYTTCLAEGLIKVGLEPDGDLTVDGKGSTLGGTWSANAGDIYEWIIETKLNAGSVASGTVAAMNAPDYELSFYTGTDEYNTLDLLDAMIGNCSIWYGANRAGEFDGGVFGIPAVNEDIAITEAESDRDSINAEYLGQVAWKVTLRYRKNPTVQAAGSLATGIGEDNQRLYSTEWLTVSAEDASVKTAYPEAAEVVFDSFIYDVISAQAEADKLLAYWKTPRRRVRVQTSLKPLTAELGDTVKLTNERFYLSGGKRFMVTVFDEYYLAARTALTLAG